MDLKEGSRRPRGFSFCNPPPVPLPPGVPNTPAAAALYGWGAGNSSSTAAANTHQGAAASASTTAPNTRQRAASTPPAAAFFTQGASSTPSTTPLHTPVFPLTPSAGTTLYTTGEGYRLPPPMIHRGPQDQAHIERVQLSLRHIDDDVGFIHTQVDDVLRDPNLAGVREAGRRIAMAARVLRWNFERMVVLDAVAREEMVGLREEVRRLRAAAAAAQSGNREDEDTASTIEGVDTPAASTASIDGDNDRAI
ncbi:hypothetical protein C8A05DRAFT_38271 [Staphylotrichum tortipilum]|uniref:Uncharacterized protein n=1 Tax=Staphylotrichum tortipilum TaxID=2831512 RepID=A0AAN6MD77_9PEZI|nr:hypothetical protein C8A05DRAFT_38271 [Staphylotrichum longicolle]